MIKKVGNWFFRHGIRVIGTGSFQALDVASLSALEGLTATVTSLVALAVASLSALQGLTVAGVGSLATVFVGSNSGLVSLAAGSAFVVVSAAAVKSNSTIVAALHTSVASDQQIRVYPTSLVDGVSFRIDASAAPTAATNIAWSFLK